MTAVFIIVGIVALSVIAVHTAEEPIDTVMEVEAGISGLGLGMSPLSTKLATANNTAHGRKPAESRLGHNTYRYSARSR